MTLNEESNANAFALALHLLSLGDLDVEAFDQDEEFYLRFFESAARYFAELCDVPSVIRYEVVCKVAFGMFEAVRTHSRVN
jgi:hypothetical protein